MRPNACVRIAVLMLPLLGIVVNTAAQETTFKPAAASRSRVIVYFTQTDVALAGFREAIRARRPAVEVASIVRGLERAVGAERALFVRELSRLGGRMVANWWIVNACAVDLPSAKLEALEAVPGVAKIEQDSYVRPLSRIPIKGATSRQNHDSDAVQALGLRGRGTCVAILDTGADAQHGTSGRPHAIYYPDGDLNRPHRLVLNRQIGLLPKEDRLGHGLPVTAIAAGGRWPGPLGDHGHAPQAAIASYSITDHPRGAASITTIVSAWQAVAVDRARYRITVANNSYGGFPDPTHVTQQALDSVALNADVLICVAAGNLTATKWSQSAANGLAVGQAIYGTHVTFGVRGPLYKDPSRLYPDILGISSVLHLPVIDDETRTGSSSSGTSFASPQVAGIATLLRAAVPALSAVETKAILLASAKSVARSNLYEPYHDRNAYGVGLAHAARGIEVLAAKSYGRAKVTTAQPTWTLRHNVTRGMSYRVAITWMRQQLASRIWSNLDVEVLDVANRRLALADTPRNLYELATFRAPVTAPVTIRVTAKSLDATSREFAWAIAAGEGPFLAAQPEEYGSACPGSGPSIQSGLVLPTGTATQFGNGAAASPLSGGGLHYQQLLVLSSGPKRTIQGLGFRPDEATGSPGLYAHLTIRVGYTDKLPSTLVPTYSSNWKAPPKEVFRDWVRFPARIRANKDVGLFRPVLLFNQTWTLDPALGNLLIEFETGAAYRPAYHQLDGVTGRPNDIAFVFGPRSRSQGAVGVGSGYVVKLIDQTTAGERPQLYADQIPFAGDPVYLVSSHGRLSSPAVLFAGQSRTRWGNVALPLDLAPFGAPGCKLLCAPDWMRPMALDAAGYAEVRLDLPPVPEIVGLELFYQAMVLDPPTNRAGLVLTNGLRLLVGAQL